MKEVDELLIEILHRKGNDLVFERHGCGAVSVPRVRASREEVARLPLMMDWRYPHLTVFSPCFHPILIKSQTGTIHDFLERQMRYIRLFQKQSNQTIRASG